MGFEHIKVNAKKKENTFFMLFNVVWLFYKFDFCKSVHHYTIHTN